jgi:hypothetical protein
MDKSIQADLLLPISDLFLCRFHLISVLSSYMHRRSPRHARFRAGFDGTDLVALKSCLATLQL